MLRKVLKYSSIVGAVGIGAVSLRNNEWQISDHGVVRFGRAAVTVGAIALDYKFSTFRFKDDSDESQAKWSQVHQRSANRLLSLCSTNGGVFIKVGQHIATLEYLVPKEYCSTLKVLQSKAPMSTFKDIVRVIREDLNKEPEEIFKEIEKKPIGTASLAQVYKATLKNDQVVALKVQHPKVRRHSLVDMTTMDMLVRIVHKLFPDFSFLWLAEQMKINLPLELDFVHEAHNAEQVKKMFADLPWLKIPEIHWEYCAPRVLTMEYVEGGEVTDRHYMNKNQIDVRTVSQRLGQLYSRMIFNEGYVHCDPHPGNLLVRKCPSVLQIVLLDHGLYTTLPERFRNQYSQMWLSIIDGDVEGIKKWGEELGAAEMFPLLACIIAAKPWDAVSRGVGNISGKLAKKHDEELKQYAKEYFPEIAKILSRVPRELLLIFKTNDLLRGIETSLGTKGERRSLITMSKCCVQAVYDIQSKQCESLFCALKLNLRRHWTLTKLSIYQFYLWICSALFEHS